MATLGFDTLHNKNATVDDTLALIVDFVNEYSRDGFAKDCAAKLNTGDKHQFIRNLFDYYCRNVDYILDTPGIEKVYTPARTIYEGKGDCKKAATFIASVLKAGGVEPILKHVYYDGNDLYTHIYVIVPDIPAGTQLKNPWGNPGNNYITLDPTNDCQFNKEVNYKSGTLYFLNGKKMELRAMGKPNFNVTDSSMWNRGVEDMMGAMSDCTPNAMRTGAAVPAHTITQAIIESKKLEAVLPASAKGKSAQLLNIPLAQQRSAFIQALNENLEGMAAHVAATLGKNPKAFDTVWAALGGTAAEINQMKAAALAGSKKKASIAGNEYVGKLNLKGILHSAAGVLHALAPIANAVLPGAGAVLENVAEKAGFTASQFPVKDPKTGVLLPPPLPPDIQGGSVMGSIPGFIFKSTLIISMLHINPTLQSVLETIAIVAPIAFVLIKKTRSWVISQHI